MKRVPGSLDVRHSAHRGARTPARRRLSLAAVALGTCLGVASLPAYAAAPLIGTSTAGEPLNTAHKYFTHYANGHYWVAFDTGGIGGSFNSSPDGMTWTSLGQVFPPPPNMNPNSFENEWAVRYMGNTVIAAVYNAGGTPGQRYYRSGTLNSDGTVTWSALTAAGPVDTTFNALNLLINNGRPIMWRDDNTAGGAGAIWLGSAIASPTWTKTTADAPAMTGTSSGIFTAGAVFPTGGANPDDLIVLRATTAAALTAGSHRLVAMKWNAATDTYDGAWYNVSTLNGGLAESMTTEVQVNADSANQKRFAAVRDTSGNIHAIYVNRRSDMVHYRKAVGFNDSWTQESAGINPVAENIDMVALTALANNNLLLFYSKGDDIIYQRRFDGAAWGAETLLLDVTPTLRRVLAPPELALDCSIGLAFVEGTASPWNVRFTTSVFGGCSNLQTARGAGTATITGPGSFRMRFNQAAGGGIDQFYDLAEDGTATTDLVGGDAFHRNFFIDEIVQGTGPFVFNYSSEGQGNKLDVLEATPTRSRVRQTAFFSDAGPNGNLRDVYATGDYSIYPPGKMALSWSRWKTPSATVNYDTEELQFISHYGAAPPLNSWASYHDAGALNPLGPAGSTFLLAKTDVAGARTDFLPIYYPPGLPVATQTVANSVSTDIWQTLWRDNNTGTIVDATFRWLTYFKPTNLGNTGSPWTDPLVTSRATDYRTPSAITVGPGTQWQDAAENTAGAGDFFNESEAAYVFDLNPNAGQGLTFDMSGSVANPRYSPFFKIRQWRSFGAPSTITVEGVTKARNVDYKADVKPVARAHFAQEVLYHTTLESVANFATFPQTGDPAGSTVNGGVTFPVARYGRGAQFSADGDYLTIQPGGNFDPAQGAIEFWYQPSYDYGLGDPDPDDHGLFGYWIDANNFFYASHDPAINGCDPSVSACPDDGLVFEIQGGAGNYSRTVLGAGVGFTQWWRANDWVHLRFAWRAASVGAQRVDIYVNGKLATPSGTSVGPNYPTPVATEATFNIGDRGRNDVFTNYANGIIDEFHIFSSPDAPAPIAHGGLTSEPTEYLADNTRNFTLAFDPLGAFLRGEYLYIGADSKFRGLNIGLATAGAGPAPDALLWEYWDGVRWSNLETAVGVFTDQTDSFTKAHGSIFWGPTEPASWNPYSIGGGPDLYYVRASLTGGVDYAPTPVEAAIKTDILLFQYCGDVTAAAQTFVFAAPITTAVTLSSLTATAADGAVDLAWATASELQNLGFHLYRADSADGPYTRITSSLIPGLGSSPTGRSYSYRDGGLVNGRTYFYELEDVETTGRTERHGPVSATPVSAPTAGGSGSDSGAPGTAYGAPSSVHLREVERSARHVVLELLTGGFVATPAEDGQVRLTIPGFESVSRPGEPELPMRRALVEAVAGRKVRLASVLSSDELRFAGLRPSVQSAPGIEVQEDGLVLPSEEKRREGRAFKGVFPTESALLLGASFQGETKKAEVHLFPLRWDGRRLLLSRRLLVRLEFSGTEPGEASRGGSRGRRAVKRGSHVRSGVVAQLVVKERGLYRVGYEELFPTPAGRRSRGISATSLRLSRQGESVAFHVEPSGTFGPGSSLYFLSEGSSLNPYADAVYELETSGRGIQMEVETLSSLSTVVLEHFALVEREENKYYQAGLLDAPDLWLWDIVISPGTKSFSFTVDQLSPSSSTGHLSLALQGASDFEGIVDHHVRVRVNAIPVGDVSWDGKLPQTLDIAVPPGVLREGENTLEIEDVGDTGVSYSMVFLNRFSISYPRLLVATGGTLEGRFEASGLAFVEGGSASSVLLDTTGVPRWLQGMQDTASAVRFPVQAGKSYLLVSNFLHPEVRFLEPSTLKDATNQADYLLLAPKAFLEAAQPLLELRQSQGLTTKAVSLEEVFAQFGHGETSPEAIKEFLEYAYQFWADPSPRYVLLLGDASYDPKNYLKTGVKDWLPGFPVKTSFLWTVSDPTYAAVNGEDLLPDLALGRLSAGSVEEAQRLIQKVLAFENGGGNFDGAAVLVADNADVAGNFEQDANEIASTLLASRNPKRIYYSQEGANTRTRIKEALDEGASLMSYVGHGGTVIWASENIFNFQDVNALALQPQQPLLLTLNCLNGFFHFPSLNSLGEAFVKAEGKGAIAAFSPSGLSVNDAAHRFHKALLQEVLSGRHERLGDAVLAAQKAYADSGAFRELLSIYNLFGDPALRLQ